VCQGGRQASVVTFDPNPSTGLGRIRVTHTTKE